MPRIEEEMNARFENDAHKMMVNIMYSGNWIRNHFESLMKPFGLSSPQFNILRILRGAGDWLNMHEVKERMVEKSPNTTRLVDKLVEKDLIVRQRCKEDRRMVHLKLSEVGGDVLAKMDQVDKTEQFAFTNNLTEAEINTLSDLLDKLRG